MPAATPTKIDQTDSSQSSHNISSTKSKNCVPHVPYIFSFSNENEIKPPQTPQSPIVHVEQQRYDESAEMLRPIMMYREPRAQFHNRNSYNHI